MRWAKKLRLGLFALMLISVAAISLFLLYFEWQDCRFTRNSPIAADLPSKFQDGMNEFRRRVRERFQIGSKESELISVLTSQGFKGSDRNSPIWYGIVGDEPTWFTGSNAKGQLILDRAGFPCRLIWNVVWQANEQGQLTAIYAEFHGICL